MFHSGFHMDYGPRSRTGKLVSYHMFKQVCVYSCVFYALLLSDCGSSSNNCMNISYSCSPMCVCFTKFSFFRYFTNFVYEWACLLLLSRLDAFWQVSQSTVNSVCYQSSYSYTCCISSFFISCFHHTSLSFYSHPKKVSQVSMECTAPQDWTCFTYTVPQPVVNVDIIVPIMTFVLYVCQRMVCTVMYASRQ